MDVSLKTKDMNTFAGYFEMEKSDELHLETSEERTDL